MSAVPAALPDLAQVAYAYRNGETYQSLGARYGCSASTVRNKLMAWAADNEVAWPLRQRAGARPHPGVVSADLVKTEIAATCRRFRLSQKQLAELAGVSVNVLHKISSGHKETIYRKTQGKILEACSLVYTGEVVLEPVSQLILPMHARDICSNGHPWRGLRWPSGVRKCNQCSAAKHARADDKRRKVAS